MTEPDSIPHPIVQLRIASGIVLVLLLTGLYAWLKPLSLSAQWALLMHTAGGLLAIPLLGKLFWKHGKYGQKYHPSRWYQPAWVAAAGLVGLCATGVALTGVGLFGSDSPYLLHWTHLGLTFVVGAVVIYHVVRGSVRAHFRSRRASLLLAPVAVAAAAVLAGAVIIVNVRAQPQRPGDFRPSNARSAGNRVVAPALLNNSASCGRCHAQIYRQWLPGAHHYAATDVFYQAVRTNYIHARGAQAVRYCEGCHEPVTLLGGITPHVGVQPEAQQGSSCAFCHGLRNLATRGNANYVLDPPKPYLFEQSSNPLLVRISDALIRLDPKLHQHDYDVKPSQTAVFCGSCHKQYIDQHENGFGFLQLQDQYDDWKNGPWHTNPKANLVCQDCHMPLRRSSDPARTPQGMIHDHRILAANNFMAAILHLPGAGRQDQMVTQWMTGKTVIPEIDGRWPRGPIVTLDLQPQGALVRGRAAGIRAMVINAKVGHAFPTGPLDVTQAWLEFAVTDVGTGKLIYHTGYLDSSGAVTGPTVQYRSYPLDRQGRPIYTHSLWETVGSRDKRAILPGMSDSTVFRFTVPQNTAGPLQCTLTLRYRRFNDQSQKLLLPPKLRPLVPILTISTSTQYFPVGKPERTAEAGAGR